MNTVTAVAPVAVVFLTAMAGLSHATEASYVCSCE